MKLWKYLKGLFSKTSVQDDLENEPNSTNGLEGLKDKLQGLVHSKLSKDVSISADLLIETMIDFYVKDKPDYPVDSEDDEDMLLFQYGTYDWDRTGAKFELDITRQLADPNDEEFYQICFTLFYRPDDIGQLEAFNSWSIDAPTLEDWKQVIKSSEGYGRAILYKPLDYRIELTKT